MVILSPYEELFCRYYAMGNSGTRSVELARRDLGKGEVSKQACYRSSVSMLKKSGILKRVEEIKSEILDSLIDVDHFIKTSIPDTIGELMYIVTIDWQYDNDGNPLRDSNGKIVRRRISSSVLREKFNAIRLMLSIGGYSETKKVDLSYDEKLMLVLQDCSDDDYNYMLEHGRFPDHVVEKVRRLN